MEQTGTKRGSEGHTGRPLAGPREQRVGKDRKAGGYNAGHGYRERGSDVPIMVGESRLRTLLAKVLSPKFLQVSSFRSTHLMETPAL